MPLDLSSLSQAITSLKRALSTSNKNAASADDHLKETLRAGVIQNFEVAYEQSWKMIRRWIKENRMPEDADNPKTRKDIFRLAAQYGLIRDPLPWFRYGDARNITSHTYNKETANTVYNCAEPFLEDADFLLSKLESAND